MNINKQTKEFQKRHNAVREVVKQIIEIDAGSDEQAKFKDRKTIELMQSMVWPTVVRGRSKREKDKE